MNISIDSRGINLYKGTGIGTYTENLVSELLKIDEENNYTLFWTGKDYESFKKDNSKIVFASKKHGTFYENYYFPNYIETNNITLHHIPQNGIGLSENYTKDCIVTIHDLIPYIMPQTVGKSYLERFIRDMPRIIKQAKGILTVSEYSKKDILKFFNYFPEERIFVTPLAANSNFKPIDKKICDDYVNSNFNVQKPYILYIGGFSTRKNVKELILAFNKVNKDLKTPHVLLLAGSVKDEGKKLKDLVNDLNIQDSVIFTGFIEDNILPMLYSGAEAFIYPSLYEGFGLPPLEAMSCKTAVITSNLTSIPEVTGDAAILIDPFNGNELSTALFSILSNPNYKNELALKGYERSLKFSWENTAKLTLNAYKEICSLNRIQNS